MSGPPPTRRARVPASVRLARWRWGRRIALAAVLLLAVSILLGWAGLFGYHGDDWSAFDRRRCRVVRVVSGDTLVVRPADGSDEPADVTVRLAGVAAPAAGEYWAEEGRQALAGRVAGKDVVLRLEPAQTRAADGALLAYLYLTSEDDLNLSLIRDGHAYADRRRPHSWQQQFDQAETEARLKRRGLWQAVTEAQMPPWRQDWLRQQRQRRQERAGPHSRPAGN